MKRTGRILLIAFGVVCVLVLAFWLNLPGSAIMFFEGLGQARHPVAFTFRLANLPGPASSATVNLTYTPKTPILGITEHWWSIIAPASQDVVRRELSPDIEGGALHFEAPLALVGLSNYRLASVVISLPGGSEPLQLEMGPTNDEDPPLTMTFPLTRIANGTYTFDGPYALWKLTGGGSPSENGVEYSPRASVTTRQVLWPDLRSLDATVDFARYPVPTFQAPVAWQGQGWTRDGINLSQPGAYLSDQALKMHNGKMLTIPFARDCTNAPQFVVVAKRAQPAWSAVQSLWAPIATATWDAFARTPQQPGISATFVPAKHLPSDGVEAIEIRAQKAGTYRLFAACPSQGHSVAVTWLDVEVQ